MSTIIVKNDSTAEIFIDDLGIGIPANSEINLTDVFRGPDIPGSRDLENLVENEYLIVSNGSNYLSVEDGLKHISYQTGYEDYVSEEEITPGVASWYYKRTPISSDYNPSLLTTDYMIAITDTTYDRQVIISTEDIQSGSTSKPRVMIIKDESLQRQNKIVITLENDGTINGYESITMKPDGSSLTIYLDGENGWIE